MNMETMTRPSVRTTERLSQTVAALARLLDQTMTDIQALDSEMQEQTLEARAQATVESETRFETEKAAALEALRKELTAQWDAEKTQLVAECERANLAVTETDEAAAIALERQIARAVERVRADLTARFEADKAKLLSERNRAQQRLADAASEFEQQLEQAKKQAPAPQAAAPAPAPNTQLIRDEVTRVEGLIQKISDTIEDPDTELSVVIRKNAERAELESYLRGLRFKIS
jgi:hypothetical protein